MNPIKKNFKNKKLKIHERPTTTQKKNESLIYNTHKRVKKDFSSNTHTHRRKDDDDDDDNKNKNNKNNDEDDEKEEKPPPPKVLFLPSLRFVFLFRPGKNDDKDNEVFL